MKTIQVNFPIEEAVDILRLLRAESRCLIENGDVLPDIDVLKRAQNVLSAREGMVTELEAIGLLEEEPAPLPQMGLDLTQPNRINHPAVDTALEEATIIEDDRESIAWKHGVTEGYDGVDALRRNW